ncbi:MAG: tetratricopeptide repeat protein [Bacteroidota bacterium]
MNLLLRCLMFAILWFGLMRSAKPQITQQDSATVDTLLTRAWQYVYSEPDTFIWLTDSSLRFSQQKQFYFGEARAYYYLGVGAYVQAEYDTALVHCERAIEAYHLSGTPKLAYSLANVENIRGLSFNALGDYPAALEAFQNGLRFNQEAQDAASEANAYHNMAMVYDKMSEYQNALEYFQKGRTIRLSLDNPTILAESDLGVGTAFLNLYQDDSARVYLERARLSFGEEDNIYGLSRALNSLGILAMDAKQNQEAANLFRTTLDLQREMDDQDGMLSSLINLGELEYRLREYGFAERLLLEAYQLADSLNSRSRMIEAGKLLTQALEAQAKLKPALKYQRLITLLSDTMFQENRTEALAEMETRYKTEQQAQRIEFQDQQIAQEQREKRILAWSTAIGIILLISLFGLLYNRYRLRKKVELEQALTEERKERFAATLTASEEERKRIATELHDGLGQLLSTARMNVASLDEVMEEGDTDDQEIYATSLRLIDNACQEVRQISHDLMPGALSRGGLIAALEDMRDQINTSREMKLELAVEDHSQRLPDAIAFNLYRIVQEVVNNMLRHAEASEIKLIWENNRTPMRLTIADNGKGMDKEMIGKGDGLGWQNLQSRLDLLNGRLDTQTAPGQGLRLQIEIPPPIA